MSFDMVGRPPIDNLFPYTTLFRSLATQPIASAIQPELETIATEAAVAAIGGGTAGRDAIRGILQDPNSQVHKETTLHGKITALKAAVTTATGNANLANAIDTALATQPIASAIQPELETIATEAAVAAIGGGTDGRDAIRGILQDPNSQVHKETTLHGKITALKYGFSKLIDDVDHFAFVDNVFAA